MRNMQACAIIVVSDCNSRVRSPTLHYVAGRPARGVKLFIKMQLAVTIVKQKRSFWPATSLRQTLANERMKWVE